METTISQHNKDIIQKYANALFRNASLEFYGIKTAPIRELINIELPIVEVGESSADFIFLLEDDTYLHFEFQSSYSKDDLRRFAMYDLRLYGRDNRNVNTVIIYTADVKKVPDGLAVGSVKFNPEYIMMGKYNGDTVYNDLYAKLKAGRELTDTDMMNLIFLPLMSNTLSREELAENSVKLAQSISDAAKRNACIASAFAFAKKYLTEYEIFKLLEVLEMTDLAEVFVEKGVKKGIALGRQEGRQEEKADTVKNALKKGYSIDDISDLTGLDEFTIKRIQDELNKN